MILLNVLIFTLSGTLGLKYLKTTLGRLSEAQAAAAAPPVPQMPQGSQDWTPLKPVQVRFTGKTQREVKAVFSVWMVVFALVGSQMAWVLRPFLGRPHVAFTLLRGRESSFFEGVFHAIRALIS